VLDIDLAILAADPAEFDEYERAIRAEYAWVPDENYRAARAKILQSFLDRERIYRTAPFAGREARARANIERALSRLR
jgi:predicted metal-dependent HD superfamily phosphohydrolase